MDKEDHYDDGHHDEGHHGQGSMGHGGHHGDAGHHNDYNDYENYDNDDSWGWLDDAMEMIGPFLADSDQLCPILGMIGEGWEEGCRKSMEA